MTSVQTSSSIQITFHTLFVHLFQSFRGIPSIEISLYLFSLLLGWQYLMMVLLNADK